MSANAKDMSANNVLFRLAESIQEAMTKAGFWVSPPSKKKWKPHVTIVDTRYGKPRNKKPWGGNVVAFPTADMVKSSLGTVDLGLAAIERVKLSKRDRQYPISDRNENVATFQVYNT
ncbi:hypothetical protein DM01DRAFT_1337805, partial [Hesseltinella vesiculosa]